MCKSFSRESRRSCEPGNPQKYNLSEMLYESSRVCSAGLPQQVQKESRGPFSACRAAAKATAGTVEQVAVGGLPRATTKPLALRFKPIRAEMKKR